MFRPEDIEIPKEELELLAKSDPTLLSFVVKAANAFRTDSTIRLACFSSEQMDRDFLSPAAAGIRFSFLPHCSAKDARNNAAMHTYPCGVIEGNRILIFRATI